MLPPRTLAAMLSVLPSARSGAREAPAARILAFPPPVAWAAATVGASAAAWWLTGQAWPAALIAVAGGTGGAVLADRTQRHLRQALTQADAQLEALETTLRRAQKMEAIGRLTAGIAHDFNNHLTVISSNVELTASRLGRTEDGSRRHLDAAMEGVRRAASLSSRLLSLARRPAAEPEAIEVHRLVNGLSDLLRRTIGDRVQLQVRLPPQSWCVWADVNRMENAILSLIVNMREQVRDGGVLLLAVSHAPSDVSGLALSTGALPMGALSAGARSGTPPAGECVQLAAVDSEVPEAAWSEAAEGVSAELSMARAFARLAGGCLQSSRAGARLVLPRYVPPALCPPASRRREEVTILLVEDDAAVRAACAESLRDRGYAVLEAPDAMEAFRLLADIGGIDLLLTDLGLPGGVSGRMLADAARHADAAIRVLFTTGHDASAMASRDGVALLRKPFDAAGLVQAVRQALEAPVSERSEAVEG